MPRLIRKISSLAKWTTPHWACIDNIPSDAISGDLRTINNTLSFWRIPGDDAAANDDALLALLGTMQRLDKIDVVYVEEQDLSPIAIRSTLGDTFFEKASSLHVDLEELCFHSLGQAAKVIGAEVFGGRSVRLTRLDVKKRILAAVEAKKVSAEAIPSSLREDLGI